jgi:hypothetical protein
MPRARGSALVGVCRALAGAELVLDPGIDRAGVGAALRARPGIGPWTAAYIAMRGLGDPDVMLAGDLGVRHAVAALGGGDRPREIERAAHAWRPWRSYAVAHLWASLEPADPDRVDGGPVSRSAPAPGSTGASTTAPAGAARPAAADSLGPPNPAGGHDPRPTTTMEPPPRRAPRKAT